MSAEKNVPTRILIADDHDIVRQGICAIIAGHQGVEVCGEAADGREAIARARDLKPDIIVIDIAMTDTLATFADQVTTVAREVGVDGRLGGQANVPGAAGTWKDLTGNVNLLADNLTNQVRAIAEVATAVTQGDLTRTIQVEARGEVAELKDNINTMITNLRLTTEHNTEQDWLKTNLARFTGMLQGQRDLTRVGRMLLSELTPLVNAQQGLIYQMKSEDSGSLVLLSAFASDGADGHLRQVKVGDGLVGQCAAEKRKMLITDLPPNTISVRTGLFEAVPKNVIVLPVLFEDSVKAVIELASLSAFTTLQLALLEQLTGSIGIVLNSIEATMQTESLLEQSQQLATELQTRQNELQQTNEQLAQKAQQLAEQNAEVERKNREIEQARGALEEKAKELALTSKYKSEFLANMDEVGLLSALRWYVEGMTKRTGINASLSVRPMDFPRLPADFEMAIFRVVQEALTNVYRHSNAKTALVEMELKGETLFIKIQDDGKGIEEPTAELQPGSIGIGIDAMRQRVAELGGNLRLSNARPGTVVEVMMPSTVFATSSALN